MSSAAEKLNKLKIADLKPILAKVGLPVSGKKNELVDRILASKEALAAAGLGEEPAPAAAQEDDMNADLPDLPPAEEPTISNTVPTPAPPAAPQAVDPPPTTTTTTTSDAPKLDDQAELRRKRAERFGIPFVDEQQKPVAPAKPAAKAAASKTKPVAADAPPASPEDLEKLRKRAERFGLPLATPGATSNGRSKSAAKETAAPPAVVDPAEEEKKRKRAEKFGKVTGAPVEKRAKSDS